MQEAIQQVREELGPEAIIYQTRRYKKRGFWWMENRGGVEIMAGVEEKPPQFASLIKEASKNQSSLPEIKEEISRESPDRISKLPPTLEKKLLEKGVEERIIKEMGSELHGLENHTQIREKLLERIPPGREIRTGEGFPRVVALVGPTGSGKTTALAKLAETFVRKRGKRVVLLNQDARRWGAKEQLEKLGYKLGIDVEAVSSPGDLTRAIEKFFAADIILLDTMGCNPMQKEELLQLKGIIRHEFIDERFLVLSINTRSEDLLIYRDRFSEIGFSGFVFTKLDETSALGNIINLIWEREENLGYVSRGKHFTECLQFLDPGKLIDEIFK